MKDKSYSHRMRFGLVIFLIISMMMSTLLPTFAFGGKISPAVIKDSMTVAKEIQAEGIVLLKNESLALPLNSKKVNVFGTGSVSPFIGGTGSGAVTTLDPVDFYESLDLAGIPYNTEIKDLYQKWYKPKALPVTGNTIINNGIQFAFMKNVLPEMPAKNLTAPVMARAMEFSHTAILMISRAGTESADFSQSDLQLSAAETELLELVTSSFKEVIVLFNTANIMEMGWLEQYPSIKAAAIIGIPGEVGFESVGQMLKGSINPSGKLADTIAYSITDHPSNENFGDYSYTGKRTNADKFVNYSEGIYVGYRYFETFAPEKVQYPFGFGLSYTTFQWETVSFFADKSTIAVKVKVTNTGATAGKDVVGLYYSAPYTPGGMEKSSIVLGGYAKTKCIEPGKSDTVTVRFSPLDMASYDYKSKEAWRLDSGVYKIKVGRTVRDFTDNYEYTVPETVIVKNDLVTGAKIGNLFDDANGCLTYFSRSNVAGTYPAPPADFTAPDGVHDADKLPAPLNGPGPAIGVKHASGTIKLADVYRNSSLWEAFLDQLTLDEMIAMTANCGYKTPGIERLGIPPTVDNDGPAAIKGNNGILYSDSGVAYPAAAVLACTWNDKLAEEFGESVGKEAENIGTNIWYAPGANIHRNPRGGRNFEYYSEDPLLTGKICAAVVRGAQSKNLVVTVKHFAVNDQETNRNGVFTWLNEQSLREVYLKAFEITVKEGGALGMMSAFNRIGTPWCGANRNLLVDLLRTEWGFKGFVVSDFSFNFTGTGYMNPALAIYGRNSAILSGLWFLQASSSIVAMKSAYNRDPAGFGTALRECIRDLCTVKMQTNAFTEKGVQPLDPGADTSNDMENIPQTGSGDGLVCLLLFAGAALALVPITLFPTGKKKNTLFIPSGMLYFFSAE